MARTALTPLLRNISGNLGAFNFRNTRNGMIIATNPSTRSVTQTPEQAKTRAFFGVASKAWKTLDDVQRNAWSLYARTYFPTAADGVGAGPTGQVVFNKAAWYLQAIGSPLPTAAPDIPPPGVPTGLVGQPSDDSREVHFTLDHSVVTLTGHRVFVEITAPMASAARHPQPSDFRAAKGIQVGSFPTLLATGATYVLAGVRFDLPKDCRFGLRVAILTPQGILGRAIAITATQTAP